MNFKIYSKKVLTEFNYTLLTAAAKPIVSRLYNPIVLNQDVIPDSPAIFAPNHRKTLDPFFVATMVSNSIHWAALKRFFTGEDSIFNNSKNPLLCKITQLSFKGMGLIPIDRGGDNLKSIKLINQYLDLQSSIGIFPEGTTNKNPSKTQLLEPKSGAFHFAKDYDVWLQPISIVWVPDKLKEKVKNSVIINFRTPFKGTNMEMSEIKARWIEEVQTGIEENNKIIDNLQSNANIDSDSTKLLVKYKR